MMGIPRTAQKGKEPEQTEDFIDMSETINNANTTPLPQVPRVGPHTGAVSRDYLTPLPRANVSLPPPPTRQPDVDKAQRYSNIIKDVIREAQTEFRANLEVELDNKIKENLQAGFVEIMNELRKMNIVNQNETPNESIATKNSKDLDPAHRRLDFINFSENNRSNSNQSGRDSNANENIQFEENVPKSISHKIYLDKWDISFDGDPQNCYVEDFIFRVEYLQQQYGCRWTDILKEVHKLLKGQAKDWYWLTIQSKRITQWEDLKSALLQQYRTNRSEYEFMRDLEERRQATGESIDSYFQVMKRLRARLKSPLPEYEMIRILKRNIKPSIGQILYPMNIFTVEQLRDECCIVERNYLRRSQPILAPRFNPPRRQVNEIVEEENDQDIEFVDEIQASRLNKAKIGTNSNLNPTCWNCHQIGHTFTDCPSTQRNLFCYRCGLEGVITPKCPKCVGNYQRSVIKAGDSRSTQTPAEF